MKDISNMSGALTNDIQSIINNGTPVYSLLNVIFSDNTYIQLDRNKFRITGNSYTQNNGDTPIGNCLCKTIQVTIDNSDGSLDDKDFYGSSLELYSIVYQGTDECRMLEGKFYVIDAVIPGSTIEITAYDAIIKTETPRPLSNQVGTSDVKVYDTFWDYFVYLCDTDFAGVMGYTLDSLHHAYADRLYDENTGRCIYNSLNYNMQLIAIKNEQPYTLRQLLGYCAQIVGGNIVLVHDPDSYPYYKIDIISFADYDPSTDIVNCGTLVQNVEDIIDASSLDENVSDTITPELLTSINYTVLNKFTQIPEIQFADVFYTKVRITYPLKDTSDEGTATDNYVNHSDTNILDLENPLLEATRTGNTAAPQVANFVYNVLCQKLIRPFSGNFLCNPLLEFGDSVIVTDKNGCGYYSYITSHTMNYLGTSDISNEIPTVARNNERYYTEAEHLVKKLRGELG